VSAPLFPLADGLKALVEPQIPDLVAGLEPKLLGQVTPVTAELLRFWFQQDYCDVRDINFHEGQRAAILHVIYAHEVLGARTLSDLYHVASPRALLEGGVLGEVTRDRHKHPKYAAKMATGTGKTWVLNALLVWQYLNKRAIPDDERFTCNFLLVAPGLIVYERLLDSFQGKTIDGERDFTTSDIYRQQDLFIPDNYRQAILGFLQSSVVTKSDIGLKVTGDGMVAITNWHMLAGVEDENFVAEEKDNNALGENIDAKAAVESLFPLTPGSSTGNSLDVLDRKFARGGPLQFLVDLPDLMVLNDEAHHIHEVRTAGEVTDVEWQKSLLEIAAPKGHKFIQMDFSATPYNEVGSGRKKNRQWFPHIVVNFDLTMAMKAGLVKALALDKRKEITALPLDFRAERDKSGKATGLSQGQRVMLQAGLAKLHILEEQFAKTDPDKHPKLLVICEDTTVTPFVEKYLNEFGMIADEVLRVDSGRKAELSEKDWEPIRERLFDVDRHKTPRVIISVLMLREGFDVSNICVVVPLRSSQASILLEQTIGRGLRLMWRGDETIDELKRETRERISNSQEPENYFDVLFVVEHPAFEEFYKDLIAEGLVGTVGDDADKKNPRGDLESVDLKPGYQEFDFEIPIVLRDADEELKAPRLDPMRLNPSNYPVDFLVRQIGKGDVFASHDQQSGTQYGDYRVEGGILTATGYNDYLSRMTNRITHALGANITKSAAKYKQVSQYPILQAHAPLLVDWLDTYIRHRLFGKEFNPLEEENWRVLMMDDIAQHIAGQFATELTRLQENIQASEADVRHILLSEVKTIPIRSTSYVEVKKCIYPKLPIPTNKGGLERRFIEWLARDTKIDAFCKIHEHRHDFMRRPYLKADGMPAQYSPDFIVRTAIDVYIVETKAQSALSDENVLRKQRAALSWVEQINTLQPHLRMDAMWSYVLLGEDFVKSWESRGMRASEALEMARVRRPEEPKQGMIF
jgi:type III restriction enzyme